jgi:hypothetical protein
MSPARYGLRTVLHLLGHWPTGNIQAHMVSSCSNSTSWNSVIVFWFFHEWVHVPWQLSQFLELTNFHAIRSTYFILLGFRQSVSMQCLLQCGVEVDINLSDAVPVFLHILCLQFNCCRVPVNLLDRWSCWYWMVLASSRIFLIRTVKFEGITGTHKYCIQNSMFLRQTV